MGPNDRKPWTMKIPQEEPLAPPERNGPRVMSFDAPASPSVSSVEVTTGAVKRLSISGQTVTTPTPPSSGPRRLSIEETPTPSPAPQRNRALNIPEAAPAPVKEEPERKRALSIPESTATAPVVPPARARAISVPDAPYEAPKAPRGTDRPKTRTDTLIEAAQKIEPTVPMQRLRGRIDTILGMSVSDILNWGQRNLAPLQDASNRKARIAAEISRINASQWLTETMNASCKVPSFMDRFTAKPPAFYEGMLQKVRGELMQFVSELDKMKAEFFREVGDLHCDALAMMVCVEEFPDPNAKQTADNRARTLLMSHQTAAMLQTTIENSLKQSAQYIQQIDSLLSVTLPNWKMAYGQK